MKTIVGAVIDSVKNLKDVVVLTLFSLSVFSLSGLQIYMGQLTQKCHLDGPNNMTNSEWFAWSSNSSHWVPEPNSEIYGAYRLCGNATGAQSCPQNYTCLQGFGPNPDYGYTSFDTFGWSLICSFRLMTQDYWEGLYMQVLKTAGSWHIIFFIISIFLGSIYLMNLILAIVAMSYNELQRRAEEEEEAAAEEEAAFLESCRQMENLQQQNHQYHGGRKASNFLSILASSQLYNHSGRQFRPSIELDRRPNQAFGDQMVMEAYPTPVARRWGCMSPSKAYSRHYLGSTRGSVDARSLQFAQRYEPTGARVTSQLRSHSLSGERVLQVPGSLMNCIDPQTTSNHPQGSSDIGSISELKGSSSSGQYQLVPITSSNQNIESFEKLDDQNKTKSTPKRQQQLKHERRLMVRCQGKADDAKLHELKRRAALIRIVREEDNGRESNSEQVGQ